MFKMIIGIYRHEKFIGWYNFEDIPNRYTNIYYFASGINKMVQGSITLSQLDEIIYL